MKKISSSTQSSQELIPQIMKEVGKALKDMTVVIPLAQLIYDLCLPHVARNLLINKLSPLAKERLKEKEAQIKDIARQAGVAHSERISLLVSPYKTEYAALGHLILIPPAELVKKEDLPEDLHVDKFDENDLAGIINFKRRFTPWLTEKFLACKKFKKYFPLAFLKTLKNDKLRKKMFQACVGHELGHYCLNHYRKERLAQFGLRVLSLPTLGLSSIFEERLILILKRRQEKQADLFAARRLGGAEGLIADFSQDLYLHQMLYQGIPGSKVLNHCFDEKGNVLKDHNHPPLTHRVAYLIPLLNH